MAKECCIYMGLDNCFDGTHQIVANALETFSRSVNFVKIYDI